MRPTPYPDLNAVLGELVAAQREILRDTLVGAYLQGSFAVGDFDEHSDVDFITVVTDELSPGQVGALQGMHPRVHGLPCPWAQHLEGSYFPRDVLRTYLRAGDRLWYLDHGSTVLERSDHCNTALVRRVVREHGVTLTGPDPTSLVDPIPVAVLRREIATTIARYGAAVLEHPEAYDNRFYQTYLVLNFARMLHDLHTGQPGSKRAGAEWAKANLDPCWHDLIDRAWSGRPDPATSVRQPADPADFARTLAFLRLILAESARYMAGVEADRRAPPAGWSMAAEPEDSCPDS